MSVFPLSQFILLFPVILLTEEFLPFSDIFLFFCTNVISMATTQMLKVSKITIIPPFNFFYH